MTLWNVASERPVGRPLEVREDGFPSVAFSSDGQWLGAGGSAGIVRLWNAHTHRLAVPPLTGHTGPVTGAAFGPTRRLLATTAMFGPTRLWDPLSGVQYGGELVGDQRPESEQNVLGAFPFLPVRSAFSSDGRYLAVGGLETGAMLWDVSLPAWREKACAIVGRNLSREEWKTYLPPGTPYRETCPQWPAGSPN